MVVTNEINFVIIIIILVIFTNVHFTVIHDVFHTHKIIILCHSFPRVRGKSSRHARLFVDHIKIRMHL
jgi:hypothetical protein